MAKLIFLNVAEHAYPVDYYIQHIRHMVHVRVNGIVTLKRLKDALLEKFKDREAETQAAIEFIDYQKEQGAIDDGVICGSSEDECSVFHFDLHLDKQGS